MSPELDPLDVATGLQVSIGFFVRRLHQSPLQDELSLPEMSALLRLDRGGPTTPSALARAEQITRQGMGATLNGLARRGLVERHPDPRDGRRTLMTLTDTGRQFVRSERSSRTRQLGKVLSDRFTREELQVLVAAVPLIERLGEGI